MPASLDLTYDRLCFPASITATYFLQYFTCINACCCYFLFSGRRFSSAHALSRPLPFACFLPNGNHRFTSCAAHVSLRAETFSFFLISRRNNRSVWCSCWPSIASRHMLARLHAKGFSCSPVTPLRIDTLRFLPSVRAHNSLGFSSLTTFAVRAFSADIYPLLRETCTFNLLYRARFS